MKYKLRAYGFLFYQFLEAALFFYMAMRYNSKRMVYSRGEAQRTAGPSIETYIVATLWVASVFHTVVWLSTMYSFTNFTPAPLTFHVLISFFNGARRVATLGTTVLLTSPLGQRQWDILPLSVAAATYWVGYISVSEYLRYYTAHMNKYANKYLPGMNNNAHFTEGVLEKLWPTSVDILIVIYAIVSLRATLQHMRESQHLLRQQHQRYIRFMYLLVAVLLVMCAKQIAALGEFLKGRNIVGLDAFLFSVLVLGIAVLWWPSPATREYENVMDIEPLSTGSTGEMPYAAASLLSAGSDLQLQNVATNEKYPAPPAGPVPVTPNNMGFSA